MTCVCDSHHMQNNGTKDRVTPPPPDVDHLDVVGGLNPGAVRARGTKNPQTIYQCSGRDCPSQSAALFIYMPVGVR